jgi:hypothetical protein
MRFRKLKIVWSAWWALSAVLLVTLWARSHRYWDQLYCPICLEAYTSADWEGRIITIQSASGKIAASWSAGAGHWLWHISAPLSDGDLVSPYLSRTSDDPPRGLIGFAVYKQYGLHPTICAPIWFLVLVAVALGSLPWIAYARRFSLRTLLIATTLVAVLLGLIVAGLR